MAGTLASKFQPCNPDSNLSHDHGCLWLSKEDRYAWDNETTKVLVAGTSKFAHQDKRWKSRADKLNFESLDGAMDLASN